MTDLDRLRDELARGPVPLSRYMELSNAHYYATRDPLGRGGDFTTAPEISQVFGELLGLWAVNEWERLGSPAAFILLELGPGRGTLMADALRAARVRPDFLKALRLHLLESSPALRAAQQDRLQAHDPVWLHDLDHLAPLPLIVIANEFVDALPIAQLHREANGQWHERAVSLTGEGFGWHDLPLQAPPPPRFAALAAGIIAEHGAAAEDIIATLCRHIARHGGSACLIDYGDRIDPARLANGDTLQAVKDHKKVGPLTYPGEADLTCHVDFAPLLDMALQAGLATAYGPQADFLRMLGIKARATRLGTPQADLDRLLAPDQMGKLFKVLTFSA